MKVKELIEILKKTPQDSVVMVDGYEDYFDKIESEKDIRQSKMRKRDFTNRGQEDIEYHCQYMSDDCLECEQYYGEYEYCDDVCDDFNGQKDSDIIDVVLISNPRR